MALVLLPGAAFTQEQPVITGLSALSSSDIRQSSIAFVNMTTSPGLEGATLELDQGNRQSTNWRSSLGFNADFVLRNLIFNGYWGAAIVGGELKDSIEFVGDSGQPVHLDLRREVVALRGSLGLSFPIDQNFKLRPYLNLVASKLRSTSQFEGLNTSGSSDGETASVNFNSNVEMLSTVGSLDAIYSRWYGVKNLEVKLQYNLIYTDAFSDDNPLLDTHDWNQTAQLKATFSGPTRLSMYARPWQWNAYANYTNFLTHNETSLGFNELFEVGAGLDWQISVKPLDWFGWQSLGLRAGFIFGEDIEGYNIGLTAQ